MALFGIRRRKPRRQEFPNAKHSSLSKEGNSIQIALESQKKPFDYLARKGIFKENETEEDLKEVRQLCRNYYKYHDLIPMVITIYSKFPLQGMRIVCRTDKERDLFYDQFMNPDKIDYSTYLVEVGKEFFKVGEVNSFGIFDHKTKEWISEEILNPDDLHVEESVFAGEENVYMDISDSLLDAVRHFGSAEGEYIADVYPDLAEAAIQGKSVKLSNLSLFRIVERANPWDTRGTPMMTRAFDSLLKQETLNAAQDAIADRLYSPLILAKLGISAGEMGPDQPPWIPTQEQLNSFSETFNQALAADFRAIVHHMGIDIRSVFGRESMPRLDSDFDRVEKNIMRAFGVGQSLLDGSNSGAYASSAINRDFVSQMMVTYQENIKKLFYHRAKIFSESRGIHETRKNDRGEDVVVYDDLLVEQEDGSFKLEKKPRPYVPEIEFATSPMKDASFEVNLLNTLRSAGVPVSNQTYIEASGKNIDIEDELVKIESEDLIKKLSEINSAKNVDDAISQNNSDVSPEVDSNEPAEDMKRESETYSPSQEGIE